MKKSSESAWADRYVQNYAIYKAKQAKLLNKVQKLDNLTCPHCGEVNTIEHEKLHLVIPEPDQNYRLEESYHSINSAIRDGVNYIALFIQVTKDKCVLSYYNALLLRDWQKLMDGNSVTVRWSAKKHQFIRTLWFVLLSLIVLTF